MKRFAILLAACFLLSPLCGAAVQDSYKFRHMSTSDSELCYDGVSIMLQDSRGFIWIGTFNGLNRYDGTRFRVYHKEELGLNSDFIHTLLEDKDGNLWIGTDAGLTRYFHDTDSFSPFDQLSDKNTRIRNKVTALYSDDSGKIYIVSNYQGVFCYAPDSGCLINYRDYQTSSAEYNIDEIEISFRRLASDGHGGFWISKYHSNLYHCDGDFSHLRIAEITSDRNYFAGDEIEQLFCLDDKLIVASNIHGLSLYDPENKSVENLFSLPQGVTLVSASFCEDRWVWLSTNKGTWRYDLKGETPTLHIAVDYNDPFSLSNDYVFYTMMDRDENLWVGTKDGGLNFSSPFHQCFVKEYHCAEEPLSGSVLSGFAYDGRRNIWITTEKKGLLKYDLLEKKTEPVRIAGLPNTLCCACHDDGYLWLGSLDGLYRLDTRTLKLKNYGVLHRTSGATDPRVYLAYRSDYGDMFFANTLGMFEYDRANDSFERIPEFDGVFVTSMCQAPDGLFWISSYATGVFLWDNVKRKIVKNFRFKDDIGLPSDKIASIFMDDDGCAWVIGFSDGFAKYENGSFIRYDRAHYPSMATDVYFCAVRGNDGNMWLNSDNGILQFNPESGAVGVFSVEDGLLDSKMNHCSIVLPDGEIFAGSNNGFVHFNPMTLSSTSSVGNVLISRMDIGGEKMPGNVDLMKCVALGPSQNSFSLEFSSLNYSSPASSKLRCCLEGYDQGWRDVSVDKAISYYNIPAGNYSLKLMSSIDGQQWYESHAPLAFVVKPRFFNSLPGILVIITLLAAVLGLCVFVIYRRQRRLRLDREAAYKRETDNEMFYDKINFFSHVVHEIKTPLTLIQTPLQNVINKNELDEDARHDLAVMSKNTDYLSTLVNELLEFVRVERHSYVLDKKLVDLVEFIDSLAFNYADSLANKNIRFSFVHDHSHVWVSADMRALNKILNNLLTNALKYAETFIELKLDLTEDGLAELSFRNDGATIPQEHRADIFKPFVQYASGHPGFHSGVGIGLPLAKSLAKMHSGDLILAEGDETCFILTMPVSEAPTPQPSIDEESNVMNSESSLPLILIADDNMDLREYVARKLKDGHQVITAADGNIAMDIIREKNVDLLITDISMPGKDGLSLCREIRDDLELSHLPIIILSARASTESKIQAINAGADQYIEKPFDFEFLKSNIRNILERRSLMRNVANSGMAGLDISVFGLPKKDEEFFTAFDSFIMQNIDNSQLSNEMIAEHLCISQSSMIRKIRKLLNTSPNSYIRSKRLSVAAQMLKDSHGNNITEICYSVGFTNISYFAKCFKEQFGMVPSEYLHNGNH